MNTQKTLLRTRNMTTIAILAAIASILFLLEIVVIPAVPFLKLDFSNLPVLLGTFAMGPVAGTVILGLKSAIGLLHSSSQGVGELADFLIGLAMVWPAGLIYGRRKTKGAAILGMAVGVVAATIVGMPANLYLLIPFFSAVYGMPVEAIVGMGAKVIPSLDSLGKFVLYIAAPFNLLKWVLISIMGALIYKPLSLLLHGKGRGRTAQIKEQPKA